MAEEEKMRWPKACLDGYLETSLPPPAYTNTVLEIRHLSGEGVASSNKSGEFSLGLLH